MGLRSFEFFDGQAQGRSSEEFRISRSLMCVCAYSTCACVAGMGCPMGHALHYGSM